MLANNDPRITEEFAEIHTLMLAQKAEADRVKLAALARVDDGFASGRGGSASSAAPMLCMNPTRTELTAEALHLLWSKAQIATGIAFSVFDNPHFRAAIQATAELGAAYLRVKPDSNTLTARVPGSQAFATSLLDQTDESTQAQADKIKRSMQSETGGSITSDGMTNVTHRPLINVLYVTPSGVFYVKTIDASGVTKDAKYIAELIISAIEAEGAENVVLVVMDGACRSSFPLIEAKFPHIFCLVCVAHSLDLLLEDFAKEHVQGPIVAGHERFSFDTSWMRDLIADCRKLVKWLTNHSKPLAFYREIAEALEPEDQPVGGSEPLKPGETRFATNFIAMERQLNCRNIFTKLVVSDKFTRWVGQQQDTAGKAAASDFKSLVLSEDHWKGLEAIVALSSPIYTLLRHCDGNCS